MGKRSAIIVVEARALVREAMVTLLESHSYRVVCSAASFADVDSESLGEAQPELVILGARPADRVAETAGYIRNLWPAAKIILLFESASAADLQKLMASELNACISLLVSPHTLIDTLQLVAREDLRIVMLGERSVPEVAINGEMQEDSDPSEGRGLVAHLPPAFGSSGVAAGIERTLAAKERGEIIVRDPGSHRLSGREEQILKALVRGHSNKVIARMCALTEATVKVHMKSILRKIRVANRTQAAIWALESSYFSDLANEVTTVGFSD